MGNCLINKKKTTLTLIHQSSGINSESSWTATDNCLAMAVTTGTTDNCLVKINNTTVSGAGKGWTGFLTKGQKISTHYGGAQGGHNGYIVAWKV